MRCDKFTWWVLKSWNISFFFYYYDCYHLKLFLLCLWYPRGVYHLYDSFHRQCDDCHTFEKFYSQFLKKIFFRLFSHRAVVNNIKKIFFSSWEEEKIEKICKLAKKNIEKFVDVLLMRRFFWRVLVWKVIEFEQY